jgi:hypothetical protein
MKPLKKIGRVLLIIPMFFLIGIGGSIILFVEWLDCKINYRKNEPYRRSTKSV